MTSALRATFLLLIAALAAGYFALHRRAAALEQAAEVRR